MNIETVIRNPDFAALTYSRPAQRAGHTVERWYDRLSRNWIVQYKDADGHQLGDAGIVGNKHDAIFAAEIMAGESRE